MANSPSRILDDEYVSHGPYSLFDGSFIWEIIQPSPQRHASTVVRATFKAGHANTLKGKKAAQTPPLHIHMFQGETFHVLSGKVGVTVGYDQRELILTPSDPAYEIKPWVPHTPWPVAECEEDTTILMIPSPDDVEGPMDGIFFRDLLVYLSEVDAGRAKMDPFQLLLMQHVTDSTGVMFPGAWFLGPLRWWVPLKLQAGIAWMAGIMGYQPRIARFEKMK